MKTPYSSFSIAFLLVSVTLSAQTPVLLKDINPTGASMPSAITCFGDVAYFQANDGVHGAELWRTDGTESGTVLVKDIVDGPVGCSLSKFMELDGTVYFLVYTDGVDRLWRTDGTASGTQLALDFADVDGLMSWREFAKAGDRIYFIGQSAVEGRELWSTDGTAAGTHLVADINPGTANSGIGSPAEYNGQLYFSAASDNGLGAELWVSDGTAAGTVMVKDVKEGFGSSSPIFLTVAGDLLYFRAEASGIGEEVWVSDGTEAGTHLVKDIYPGNNTSLPAHFAAHNGELYFSAVPANGANFLYRTNGTEAGTVPLPKPSYAYNYASGICSHNGMVYFLAYGDFNQQLWRTDGTAAGSQEFLYPDPTPPQPLSNTYMLTSCNGALIFRAKYIEAIGDELYTITSSIGLNEPAKVEAGLYPNPSTGLLQAENFPLNGRFQLFATDGRMVLDLPAQRTVDVSSLADGTYIVRITNTDGRAVHSRPVVLQR